jgi:hypothetical protein
MSARNLIRAIAEEFRGAAEQAMRDALVDVLGRRDVWVAIAALSPSAVGAWPQNEDGSLRPPTLAEIAKRIGEFADALRAESWRSR